MRKKLLFLLPAILLVLYGCNKNKFNFDRMDGVDLAGEWGIPLVNAEYSVNDLIKQLNDEGYISQTGDGNLFFSYESDEYLIADASELLKFPGFQETFSHSIPNIFLIDEPVEIEFAQVLNLDNEHIIIKRAEISGGEITLNVNHNITSNNIAVTITIPEFKTATDEIFQVNLSVSALSGNFSHVIDLDGLVFSPTAENNVTVKVQLRFAQTSATPQEEFDIDVTCDVESLALQSFLGQASSYAEPFSSSFDFDLFSNNYGGALTIYDPNLYIAVRNSFYVTGELRIDTACFYGPSGESSLLETTPEYVSIPVSPVDFQIEEIENMPSIRISTDYKSIKMAGEAVFNPGGFDAGDIYIDQESKIEGKYGLSIPFAFNIENIYYNDTIPFSLEDIATPDLVEDVLQEALFRFAITNGLPLNMSMQAYFYNSTAQQLTDSLFSNGFTLPGSINGATPSAQITTQVITFDRLDNLINSDQIILRFKVNTDGHRVDLNVKDHLKVKLGVKLKYDTSGAQIFSRKED
ncbi:hypothetical protein LJC68_03700 [Bacteroidales bacterium OttesenSCG-928-B11]|nr:hypothetical protein [Bacteroidales bacterium OttesenSCG-928-C03]MDL2311965.1 hypothetical protein [Bacteroidales bacterium OttesenSCG-928-B11]